MNSVQVKRVTETVREFAGLGERIRVARERDGRTLTAIAKACNLSRQYWYQLESEKVTAPITEDVVRRIEQGLGVDLKVKFED